MPTKGIRDLRQIQFCFQEDCDTPGTVVERLVGQCGIVLNPHRVFPSEATGLMSKNIVGRCYDTCLIGEGPLTPGDEGLSFQELIYYLSMGAVGGISPTAAPPVYTWNFCPDLAAGDLPDVITLICGDNAAQWQGTCGFAKSLTLSGAFCAPWSLTADMVVQDWDNDGVSFEEIEFPDPLEVMLGQMTEFYLDTSCSFAAPTQLTGFLIDWGIITPGFHPKFFADGRLDYTTMGLASRSLEVAFTLEFDDETTKAVVWEAYRNQDPLYVRFFVEGGVIPGDSGTNYSATFDMVLELKSADTLGERDGNDIMHFVGETTYDKDCDNALCAPTEGFEWAITVVSGMASLPACV